MRREWRGLESRWRYEDGEQEGAEEHQAGRDEALRAAALRVPRLAQQHRHRHVHEAPVVARACPLSERRGLSLIVPPYRLRGFPELPRRCL